jgi:hypothetical protein
MNKALVIGILGVLASGCATKPIKNVETSLSNAPVVAPEIKDVKPISAIVVTNCGLAVALFVQLDQYNLFRADPRQSDLFTNVDGKMIVTHGAGMPWDEAYTLAASAILSSNVVIPCNEGPTI